MLTWWSATICYSPFHFCHSRVAMATAAVKRSSYWVCHMNIWTPVYLWRPWEAEIRGSFLFCFYYLIIKKVIPWICFCQDNYLTYIFWWFWQRAFSHARPDDGCSLCVVLPQVPVRCTMSTGRPYCLTAPYAPWWRRPYSTCWSSDVKGDNLQASLRIEQQEQTISPIRITKIQEHQFTP